MARDAQPQHSNLYNALLPIALILGGLIIVAVFVVWLTSAGQADVPASDVGGLNPEVMQRFENEWDQLGVAIGDPDAPVTIREFGDYQCPSCKAFAATSERIREELVASGKVRFIFFAFPLAMHENSFEASVAARCAARQDKYWAYHEALFANQREWASMSDPMSMFLDLAVEVGIKAQRLKQCIVQGATRDAVVQTLALAKKIGIRATPTVMVGSKVFSGAVSYERVKTIVEAQTGGTSKAAESMEESANDRK